MARDPWHLHFMTWLGMACAFTATVAAQTSPAQKPTVTSKGAAPIASAEGKDNFEADRAVCHGKEGKGDGPAAPAMKSPVPDLTTMAKRNNGKFDSARRGASDPKSRLVADTGARRRNDADWGRGLEALRISRRRRSVSRIS